MGSERVKVVVVGAGLAGLRCADRLAGKVDVVLLEAQDRVGGRCWSSRDWRSGQVAEHGGELIEDGQNHVLDLVTERGLTLESRASGPRGVRLLTAGRSRDATEVRGLNGVLEQLTRDLASVGAVSYRDPSRALRELDDMTAHDWIEANVDGGLGSELGSSLHLGVQINLGFDPRALSAVSLLHMWLGLPEITDYASGFRFGHDAETAPGEEIDFGDVVMASVIDVYHVDGGNDLIAQGLAERLPPGVLRLSSPVTAVARENDGRFTVSVAAAPAVRDVDRVVLAAPMPVLRGLDLVGAGLSPLRQQAIAELPMGMGTKLMLQLDAPPGSVADWPGLVLFDDPAAVVWETSRGQNGDSGILTIFTADRAFTSAHGAHGAADPASLHRAEQLLERIAPDLARHSTGAAWLDSWPDDPWARGSYAGYAPGHYARFAGFLGEPEGAMHFAGEHTSLASFGYLDGALASGERAAEEILAAVAP